MKLDGVWFSAIMPKVDRRATDLARAKQYVVDCDFSGLAELRRLYHHYLTAGDYTAAAQLLHTYCATLELTQNHLP